MSLMLIVYLLEINPVLVLVDKLLCLVFSFGLKKFEKTKKKKKENLPFAKTWIDLKHVIPSEIAQTEEDEYHILLLIYGI